MSESHRRDVLFVMVLIINIFCVKPPFFNLIGGLSIELNALVIELNGLLIQLHGPLIQLKALVIKLHGPPIELNGLLIKLHGLLI
ncbi:hypothetical protein A3860_01125 [Niastella vici]|uniref:Uncharacterized protein n=1 Tax=Niastella vici TaxID=1703345 RepID=A0A1V9G8U3_9BACT|nr:hypothetical protein A3860_01125 [Niastella vici]